MFPMGALVAAVVTGAIFITTLSIAKKNKNLNQQTTYLFTNPNWHGKNY